jgi:hypothetical protein
MSGGQYGMPKPLENSVVPIGIHRIFATQQRLVASLQFRKAFLMGHVANQFSDSAEPVTNASIAEIYTQIY